MFKIAQTFTPEEGKQFFDVLTLYNISTVKEPTPEHEARFKQITQKLLAPVPEQLYESEAIDLINALYYYEAACMLDLTGEQLKELQALIRKLDKNEAIERPPFMPPTDEDEPRPDKAIILSHEEQALYRDIMWRYSEMFCDEMTSETERVFNSLWSKVGKYNPQPEAIAL